MDYESTALTAELRALIQRSLYIPAANIARKFNANSPSILHRISKDCHSIASVFVFQAGPVWMLGWPNAPFRMGHKSQDPADRIGKAGPIKNLETPLPHDINSFCFIL